MKGLSVKNKKYSYSPTANLKCFSLLFSVFLFLSVQAQEPINRFYGTYSTEAGKSGFILADSTIYAMGSSSAHSSMSSQVYLIKTDKEGDILWSRFYGGNGVDDGVDMLWDTDSTIYLVSNSFIDFNRGYDIKLFKLNENGDIIWEKNYGTNDWDVPHKLIKTDAGVFIVCGETYGGGLGLADGMIFAFDENGDSLFFTAVGTPDDDFLLDLKQKSSDTLSLCGEKIDASAKSKGWLCEWRISTGTSASYYYGTTANRTFNALDFTPGGNYLIGQTTDTVVPGGGGTEWQVYVMNDFTHSVIVEFPTYYFSGSPQDDACSDIMYYDSTIHILGNTRSYGLGGSDAVVYRFDTLENYKGSYTFGTPNDDRANSFMLNNNGTFAFVGTGPYTFGVNDLWIVNTDFAYQVYDTTDSQLDINSIEESVLTEPAGFLVYPNPTRGTLYVKADENISSICIFDYLSRPVANVRQQNNIDITLLPPGMYIVSVVAGQTTGFSKILKLD